MNRCFSDRVIESRPSRVRIINSVENFEEILIQSKESGALVVVDFYATWCGPCRQIAPILDDISTQYKDVIFLKV